MRDAGEPYRLLHEALHRSRRAGIGRWVFHSREHLVAIRPLHSVLALHTMRFPDELISPDELHVERPIREPTDREVEMACTLVEALHARFEPQRFTDTYRQRVLDYLDAKRRGEAPRPRPAEEPGPPDDLLAALQASIQAATR
jgi:DNA end-binding protein Ku